MTNIGNVSEWNAAFTTGSDFSGTATITADITFTSQPQIPNLVGGATLDGGNYTLTFNYANHNGFVKLAANSGTTIVKNIKVENTNFADNNSLSLKYFMINVYLKPYNPNEGYSR